MMSAVAFKMYDVVTIIERLKRGKTWFTVLVLAVIKEKKNFARHRSPSF